MERPLPPIAHFPLSSSHPSQHSICPGLVVIIKVGLEVPEPWDDQ